ncbi:MAG: hypothetical protein K2K84_06860 [Muribaculaceae bacterium]|nr:hypothetical protein [Muribaculaceae bacterium]
MKNKLLILLLSLFLIPREAVFADSRIGYCSSSNVVSPKNSLREIINIPIYDIENPLIKQIIDSSLVVDPYKYLVLSKSTNLRYPDYVQLGYEPITERNLASIKGLYTDSLTGKSVVITDLGNEELSKYSFKRTEYDSEFKISVSKQKNIKINHLGILIYLNIEQDSVYSILIGYNGWDVSHNPSIAEKFAFLGPYFQNTVEKAVERDNVLKSAIRRRHRERAKDKSDMPFNLRGDTINKVFLYTSFSINQRIDTLITLPVYKFDNSFNGTILSRICDSIAAHDIYTELCLYPDTTVNNGSGVKVFMPAIHLQGDMAKTNGIILCEDGRYPLFLFQLSDEIMRNFGITTTKKKIVAHIIVDKIMPYPSEFLHGYYININENPEDVTTIGILFGGYKLFEEEARPFNWIIDEYVNNTDFKIRKLKMN